MKRRSALRHITSLVHRIDHTIARMRRPHDVLVEARTPVYLGVLGPIAEQLALRTDVAVWYTSENPDRIQRLVPEGRFVTHRQAAFRHFSLYMNADPWAAARLRRCEYRVNFSHGVAGKYDLDQPSGLPMGFDVYDRVGFINHDRMKRYLEAGIVSGTQAALVGYPKLDRLATGGFDGIAYRTSLGLEPARPTVLYSPTYSKASSLHLAGEAIVRALAVAGFNVIVKLHDRSLDIDPRYNAGVDWRQRFRGLEPAERVRFIETTDASPALAASDVMVTDHSSIGFEYLLLDRPLIVFDAPDLTVQARINPEKVVLLRSAATVARTPEETAMLAQREIADPLRLSERRRAVAKEMFYRPGSATQRAVALIDALLVHRAQPARVKQPQEREAAAGDLPS
jgi:hypothetical protein